MSVVTPMVAGKEARLVSPRLFQAWLPGVHG
jgi:hypothetical protein